MADVTVKRVEDFEALTYEGLGMHRVRDGLGVGAFGIQVIRIPAGNDAYPEHDHSPDGVGGRMFEQRPEQLDQEEVYTVLEGSATLRVGEEDFSLEPGVFARVGPGETRKILTGDEDVTVLAIGGVPGRAYDPDPGL